MTTLHNAMPLQEYTIAFAMLILAFERFKIDYPDMLEHAEKAIQKYTDAKTKPVLEIQRIVTLIQKGLSESKSFERIKDMKDFDPHKDAIMPAIVFDAICDMILEAEKAPLQTS